MSISTSRLSYQKEYDLMNQALAEAKGTRVRIGDRGAAWYYRLRLNNARQLDRKLNTEVYSPGHVLYGGSEFDELIFTVREDEKGQWWVYLEKSFSPRVVEAIE